MMDCNESWSRDDLLDDAFLYRMAKAHALCRGLDLTEHPHQQALVPDEVRWMRAAMTAALPGERS